MATPILRPIVFFGLLWLPLASQGQAPAPPAGAAAPAVAVAAQPAVDAVDAFSAALQAGDLSAAGRWLADDVLVLESGGAERSRAQYLQGHARHDAQFLKDAQVQPKQRTARASGDLAWVGSESEVHLTRDGKPLTLLATETMVLRRTADGWRIVHIHWSSRPRR
jgi:ketosteroid isomerase-like protein